MATCPVCGCQISVAARFCPMCGATLREDAANARLGGAEVAPVELPEPNDQIIRRYVGLNRCGAGVIRALRILLVVTSVVFAICGIVYGVMLLLDGNTLHGVASLILGPGIGLLFYVVMTIGIILYENISFIARHTETQNRIAAAQLELIQNLASSQRENLALSQQTVDLLKVMDGDRFDAAKLAERQTELLEKLIENQQTNEHRLAEIRDISERLIKSAANNVKETQTWHSGTKQYARAIALAIAQISDRLKSIAGSGPSAGESDASDAAPQDDIPTAENDENRSDDDQND